MWKRKRLKNNRFHIPGVFRLKNIVLFCCLLFLVRYRQQMPTKYRFCFDYSTYLEFDQVCAYFTVRFNNRKNVLQLCKTHDH